MTISHPIDWIPEGKLRFLQLPSVAIAVVFLAALPLVLPGRADYTLLELVEAGSSGRAAAILEHWSIQDRVRVAYAVGFDFLMNPAYMNALAVSCVWAGRAFRSEGIRSAAAMLAWLAWSVAVTNAAENVALFVAISSTPSEPWPLVAAAAHYWAGFVVLSCLVFCVVGVVRRIARAV